LGEAHFYYGRTFSLGAANVSNSESEEELSGFSAFRQRVFADPTLQNRLRSVSQPEAFVALVVQLGNENGFHFVTEDVTAAMKRGQTAWLTGWSPIL
jgi:predicted ribosomally synthesized peptide with nif11-like leader